MAATPGWQDFGLLDEEEYAAIQEHLASEPPDPPRDDVAIDEAPADEE
jgi:hypothetical protein